MQASQAQNSSGTFSGPRPAWFQDLRDQGSQPWQPTSKWTGPSLRMTAVTNSFTLPMLVWGEFASTILVFYSAGKFSPDYKEKR